MDEIKSKLIAIDGRKVHFIEVGNKKNPPLLLLSGWPVSCYMFVPLMAELRDRFWCVAVDLPGFCGSSNYDVGIYHGFDFHCHFLNQFSNEIFGRREFNLFGYSIGGVLAILYASKNPVYLNKLAVFSSPINGIALFNSLTGCFPTLFKFFHALRQHPSFHKIANIRLVKSVFLRWVYRRICTKVNPLLLAVDKELMSAIVNQMSFSDSKVDYELLDDLFNHDFQKIISDVKIRTLVLGADQDNVVTVEISENLAKKILPNASFRLLYEADHAVGVTEPKKISGEIIRFLSNV